MPGSAREEPTEKWLSIVGGGPPALRRGRSPSRLRSYPASPEEDGGAVRQHGHGRRGPEKGRGQGLGGEHLGPVRFSVRMERGARPGRPPDAVAGSRRRSPPPSPTPRRRHPPRGTRDLPTRNTTGHPKRVRGHRERRPPGRHRAPAEPGPHPPGESPRLHSPHVRCRSGERRSPRKLLSANANVALPARPSRWRTGGWGASHLHSSSFVSREPLAKLSEGHAFRPSSKSNAIQEFFYLLLNPTNPCNPWFILSGGWGPMPRESSSIRDFCNKLTFHLSRFTNGWTAPA